MKKGLYATPSTDQMIAHFWSKVDKSGSCWLWLGATDDRGYGVLGDNKFTRLIGEKKAHRISFVLAHGSIPDNLAILHKCDNPPCISPLHIWAGTIGENNRDMVGKKRNCIPACKGESHPRSKLTEIEVISIRKLYIGGISSPTLASVFGVDRTQIHNIVTRKHWNHV